MSNSIKYFVVGYFIFVLGMSIALNCFSCELLVLNRSDLPESSLWKRYDVVVVKDDGHSWGKEELNTSKFFIVKMPETKTTDVSSYTQSVVANNKISEQREQGIDVTKFTPQENLDLLDNELVLTPLRLSQLIKVKTVEILE